MKKLYAILPFVTFSAFGQLTVISDFAWGNSAVTVNDKIVFRGHTPQTGNELWVSDGTPEGTHILLDIVPGTGESMPEYLTVIDDVVYFRANQHQVWRTDGTAGGTYQIFENNLITYPFNFVKSGGFIYFQSGSVGSGCCQHLWRINGNPNSEIIVTPTNEFSDVRMPHDLGNGSIVFSGRTSSGWGLWRSNGILNEFIADLTTTSALANHAPLTAGKLINGKVFFESITEEYGVEPWVTNGTVTGTHLLKDIHWSVDFFEGSIPALFTQVGANVYFRAKDNLHGYEIWKTDGTGAGTQMLKEIYPGNNTNAGLPYGLTEMNGLLYFIQDDGVNGAQIWKSDGTEQGTERVTNVTNGYVTNSPFRPTFVNNNRIYFTMLTPATGNEPWVTDGTSEGTSMIADIAPGFFDSLPGNFVGINEDVFFEATVDGTFSGYKQFRISGNLKVTNADTQKVHIYPNPVKDILNVDYSGVNFKLEIYDMPGKLILSKQNASQVDVSGFAKGVYILKIIENKNIRTVKIIKE